NLYRCGQGAVGFFGGISWRRRLICIPEFSGHLRRHRAYPAFVDGQMDSTHVSQTLSHHVARQYCLISVSLYSAWIRVQCWLHVDSYTPSLLSVCRSSQIIL